MEKVLTVDEHISQFPDEIKAKLIQVRNLIKDEVPNATETINYGIPTYKLNGKNLVHFSGNKKHIGFYPAPSAIRKFKEELSSYEGAKGSVQFPYDQPIPLELIRKIIQFRVQEESVRK